MAAPEAHPVRADNLGGGARPAICSKKLLGWAPGILSWAVMGCLEWQREGLGVPSEVQEATEDYRAAEDRIGPFLEERCVTGPREAGRVVQRAV